MKAWKRNLLIAYLICNILMVVFFYIFALGSSLGPFLKFLLFLLGLAVILGIFVGIYIVVYAFAHEHATLHAGPGGIINIERSALESTARRALASVPGISVQHVRAAVIERKGVPVIDMTVTAIPFGEDSLMTTATQIQSSVKRAVEGFTDHEVRYVAVNFVEPRKRDEIKAAADAVDKRAAAGSFAPQYTSAHPTKTSVDEEAVQQQANRAASAPHVSLWDRAKARMAATHEAKNEDVVETDAVVQTVETAAEPSVSKSQAETVKEVWDTEVVEPVEANGSNEVEEPVDGVAVKAEDSEPATK